MAGFHLEIPHDEFHTTTDLRVQYSTGVQTVRNIFHAHPDSNRPDNEILQLLEISLTHNDFIFNDKHYLQVEGTAMGKKFSLAYANLYMAEWEREALAKCPHQPTFYYRLLDDIIGAWPHDIQLFTEFISILNSHHPSIKVKYIIDPCEVHVLDTTVFFNHVKQSQKKQYSLKFISNQQIHMLYSTNTVITCYRN
jgi:hypothetical protein